jgi:4'-phosphopantetheinyl transferase
MRIELGVDEIHLWCAFQQEISDRTLLDEYERLLSAGEQQQRSRFMFPRDRHRYVVTRALVRTTLSRYANVPPTQWTFRANAFGRPEIANTHAYAQRLVFNVSHSSDLTVVAVAFQRALGVDTENVRSRKAPIAIAMRMFAPDELAALHVISHRDRPRRFFEYWTLKESYVKARGKGLSIRLDKCSFAFCSDRHLTFWVDPDQNDHPSRWHFSQFALAGDDVVAVCTERTVAETPRLLLKKIVPLVSEQELQPEQLRTSAPPQLDAVVQSLPRV